MDAAGEEALRRTFAPSGGRFRDFSDEKGASYGNDGKLFQNGREHRG